VSIPPSTSLLTLISDELTYTTVPEFLALGNTPESAAALYSIPVPTIGACGFNSGTAWRCMFAPISALDASSFSRKGIIAVATETICLGETSIKSTSLAFTCKMSCLCLTVTLLSTNLPSSPIGSFACAIKYKSSSSAVKYLISFVTIPVSLSISLYGVSINPYSFTFAYVANELINPIFGPSGVSIGHILP